MTYLHGAGTLLASLERALTRLDVRATTTVSWRRPRRTREHDATEGNLRSAFAQVPNVAVGMRFEAQDDHGRKGHRPRHGDR
jgi:FKBP-type peptidyl-prolyl cis-trans isomerase 2